MNRSLFKKKIIIGSANFTQKYGADPIKINQIELKKILNLAETNGINLIDTANSYFSHHTFKEDKNIFRKINKKFKFIAKVKADEKWVSLDYCEKELKAYFEFFNCKNVETLMIHDSDILFKKEGKKIFKNLTVLKKKYFKKLGSSIYNPETLNHLLSNYEFDVIQSPYNILDRRIISSGWHNRLKERGIELHVRSIFLQGLLVNELVYKKKYFKKWKKKFFQWFKSLKKNNISAIDYCLTDLLNYNFDKIIIGINNCDNLKNIVNFKLIKNGDNLFKMKIRDLKLIDPRNWK